MQSQLILYYYFKPIWEGGGGGLIQLRNDDGISSS